MDARQLVGIFEACSEIEMLHYRTMLQQEGIDVTVRRIGEPTVPGDVYRIREPHYLLMVKNEDVSRAQPLVESYRDEVASGQLSVEEDDEETTAPFNARRWLFFRVLLAILIVALALTLLSILSQILR